MKRSGSRFWSLLIVAASFCIAGCSAPKSTTPNQSAGKPSPFAAPSQLTATLTNGNVLVRWHNQATADGGLWVEYTSPGADYIQLDAFDSDGGETSFIHPNVPPQTTFLYRLHPYFGKTTSAVEITTGVASTNGPELVMGPIDPTNNVALDQYKKFSIHNISTFTEAMPSNLTATLSSPTSVELRWKDRSSDEDGYLLEVSANANEGFVPCALLPPDTTSFRKTMLPAQTKCYFRVRAFFWGQPTEPVSVMTSAQ